MLADGDLFRFHGERGPAGNHRRSLLVKFGALVFTASAALAPLAFGAATTRGVAWLLLLQSLALACAPRPRSGTALKLIVAIVAGFCLWAAWSILQVYSPLALAPLSLLGDARSALGWVDTSSAMTLNPARFPDALVRGATLAAALVAGLLYGQSREEAFRILFRLCVAGALLTLATFLLYLQNPTLALWHTKTAYERLFTASFFNRGAAAAWLTLQATVACLLLIRLVSRKRGDLADDGHGFVALLLRCFFASPLRIMFLSIAFLLSAVGVLLTQGRAASVVLALDLVLVLAALWWFRIISRRRLWIVLPGAAILLALVLQTTGTRIGERIARVGMIDVGRLEIWRASWNAILERPFAGYGAGAYREALALFRTPPLSGFGEIRSAHSLPLELATESGLLVALALGGLWLALCIFVTRRLLRNGRFDAVGLAGALAGWSAIWLTGIDVVSQAYGYVLPMSVLFGLALGQASTRAGRIGKVQLSAPFLASEA